MEKIKEIIKWIAVDGLLHLLACYAIMLTCEPVVGLWWAKVITGVCAIGKELFDACRYKNTWEQASHDLLCDAGGILLADLTILAWWLFSL